MHMFCFQCQETSEGRGCTFGGHCGKSEEVANYQDLLVYALKGLGEVACQVEAGGGKVGREVADLAYESLFVTITNTNFDLDRIVEMIEKVLATKRALSNDPRTGTPAGHSSDAARWDSLSRDGYATKAYNVGVLQTQDVETRALRETVLYGLKGIAAYAHHASILGAYDAEVGQFVLQTLAALNRETDLDALFELALATGRHNLSAMSLLDATHARRYGTPQPRSIAIGVRQRPAILVSGHDLLDLEMLLQQTQGLGIDVYTHGEMISGHYYPELFKYDHLAGNYGNAWWRQDTEFERFNGPILMTSNCIIPVVDAYRDRIFTTGVAGYPGVPHIVQPTASGDKDFSELIEIAKRSAPPGAIDQGTMPGGYNHVPLWGMADRLLELVKSGAVRRIVVMGGCDGRDRSRSYYEQVALNLPKDTLILTAGCAKYAFCKLPLGDIQGLPRVLDAGQCNDCYSLIHFARRLANHLQVDVNALPVSYQVCWYDQKAVAVFLSLLALGIHKVRLGPSLPAYFTPKLVERLKRDYELAFVGEALADIELMNAGN
jgi:hydroxylamine reductase